MKKLFSLIALVFMVCAAQAQVQYVDGEIIGSSMLDGHHVMYVMAADGVVHQQSIDRLAQAFNIDMHSFEQYFTVSECIAVGKYNREVDRLRARGIVARHVSCREYYGGMMGGAYYGAGYGYPYGYGSVGARVTIGGVTIGGRATATPYGTAVSGGVNSRAVSAGGSTILPRKAKKATQPATKRVQVQSQQVQSQPQAQATTETVEINGKTYNVVKKSPAELREMIRRK